MNPQEEAGVRQMIIQTVDRLQRASASPQDLGSRYARLLELLWQKPNSIGTNGSHETQASSKLPNSGMLHPTPLPDPTDTQHSPAYDFSWLDLEAVGDYVISADQMAAGDLPMFDGLQDGAAYATRQDRTPWQVHNWPMDVNGTLLF